MRIEPTRELLNELIIYDKESGLFTWKERNNGNGIKRWNTRFAGKQAGGICRFTGYVFIAINRIQYRAHRLAWLYVYGVMPDYKIDHINMIRSDNRICNLREATRSENNYNRKKLITNSSGYKGVCWDKQANKWKAQISKDNKNYGLGHFNDPKDAHFAYCNASKILHDDFSRTG